MKTYQRFSFLQAHLDCGRHGRAAEKESLYDKACVIYATKVNEGFSKVPEVENLTQVMHATKKE